MICYAKYHTVLSKSIIHNVVQFLRASSNARYCYRNSVRPSASLSLMVITFKGFNMYRNILCTHDRCFQFLMSNFAVQSST